MPAHAGLFFGKHLRLDMMDSQLSTYGSAAAWLHR